VPAPSPKPTANALSLILNAVTSPVATIPSIMPNMVNDICIFIAYACVSKYIMYH
jgi:hypothetical protein